MNAPFGALDQALVVSSQMVDAAEKGLWDEVAELDRQRQPLLRAHDPADRRSHRLLQQLMADNQQLIRLAELARSQALQQLNQHSHAYRALSAYVSLASRP